MAISLPSFGILGMKLRGRHLAKQLSNFVPVMITSYAIFSVHKITIIPMVGVTMDILNEYTKCT